MYQEILLVSKILKSWITLWIKVQLWTWPERTFKHFICRWNDSN